MTEPQQDWLNITADSRQIAREKEKARRLRRTQWWRNKLNQGVCHYCHQTFRPAELTMDHLVPLARGGKSSRANIVAACKACNNRKKYLTPVELLIDSSAEKKSEP